MSSAFFEGLMRQWCERVGVADANAAIHDQRLPLQRGDIGLFYDSERNVIRIQHTVGRIPSAIEDATLQAILEWNASSSEHGFGSVRSDGKVIFTRDAPMTSFDLPNKSFEVLRGMLSAMEDQWVAVLDDALMHAQLEIENT